MISLGANADECNARREEARSLRPACCPGCGGTHITGNGWYPRFAAMLGEKKRIKVKRWECMGCGGTISQLPDFLHRFLHYVLALIERVLRARFEEEQTWRQLQITPSLRTERRWVAAFAAQATRWLLALLTSLAQVQPHLAGLDPHSPGVTPGRMVLTQGRTFAHWLDPGHAGQACLANALRVLWRWGWNAAVGRLV